jgi:DNA-binding MarR family transcriptional regulator
MKEILARLNPAFDHRNRLGIMALLAGENALEYNTLKDLLQMTDGNLASHLKALAAQNYIAAQKQFIDRKPRTTYAVTDTGRAAFRDHLQALCELVGQIDDGG